MYYTSYYVQHIHHCIIYFLFLQSLPLPMLRFRCVGVRAWQLGQSSRRLSSVLLSAFPSIWSISSGGFPVSGWGVDHPQLEHWLLYFSYRYRTIWREKFFVFVPRWPESFPALQSIIYLMYSCSFWHLFEQYFVWYGFRAVEQLAQITLLMSLHDNLTWLPRLALLATRCFGLFWRN